MKQNRPSFIYLSSLVDFLKLSGEVFTPLSQKKIDSLQRLYDINLPIAYIEFLTVMGKGASRFMRGSSVFYPELLELKDWAKELTDENNMSELPKNAFTFWMHQGYQMAYFLVDDSPNPTVYYFSEGNKNNDWIEVSSFTEFLEMQLIFSGLKSNIKS
ncbi:SMI1/KNR4 family protein [Bernardetia sp. OM2101]|uniref:SMI1/KNR4 family protein n=1 Tax=Bernardetia sp. OM2101 TaxID=3344876 RepID=UPI0035CF0344